MSRHLLVEFGSRTIVRPNRRFRKSRYRRRMRVLAVAVAAMLLSGCGARRTPALSGCLNDAGFLVTSTGPKVEGTTPGGVAFTLTVFGSHAAAKRAAAGLHPRTTVVVAAGVVDFHGNPDPGARISAGELRSISDCLAKSRRS